MATIQHELTPVEEKFVAEAEKGYFSVGFDDEGRPYAMGAETTSNLFSMDVIEEPEHGGGSVYTLRHQDAE